ncbi:MAG TPA: primosomal protein [Pseudonocardiaceae bacterium]
MAQDIVPIELSLTAGDLVTLWAPHWRAEGEEWEAFLGEGADLFAFPELAELVGFVRTAGDHDLVDHPAWPLVPRLLAPDLRPEESHRYDLVGVPELVADEPDTWVIGELADMITMVRSLADVCGLDVVHEVLGAAPAFDLLDGGVPAFGGRDGARRWDQLCTVIAQRWDEVLDAVDQVVRTPQVDPAAVATAQAELAEAAAGTEEAETATNGSDPGGAGTGGTETGPAGSDPAPADPALAFWSEVGIDPIRIVTDLGDYYTLRCYVDDVPVFLGSSGRLDVFGSPRALVRHVAGNPEDHDLDAVSTWPRVKERANAGELQVAVDQGNTYVLSGLADDLAAGPQTVDPVQLDLAVELITDAEQWAGSPTADEALAGSEPLGWLVSFVLRPDPTRLAPSAPFDAEVDAWRTLVGGLEDRLHVH